MKHSFFKSFYQKFFLYYFLPLIFALLFAEGKSNSIHSMNWKKNSFHQCCSFFYLKESKRINYFIEIAVIEDYSLSWKSIQFFSSLYARQAYETNKSLSAYSKGKIDIYWTVSFTRQSDCDALWQKWIFHVDLFELFNHQRWIKEINNFSSFFFF